MSNIKENITSIMEDSNLDSDPRRGKDRFLLDQKSELFYEEGMKKIKSIIDEGGGIKTTDPREAQQSKEQSIIKSFNREAVFFKRIIEDIESVQGSKNAPLYREDVAVIGRRGVNVLEIIRLATFPNSPNSQGMSDVINMGGYFRGGF